MGDSRAEEGTTKSVPLEPLRGVRYSLRAIAGEDQGQSWVIDPDGPPKIYIGTSALCEVGLHDGEVSRKHAALELMTDGRLRIEDLGSTNGTRVNGIWTMEAALTGGETLRVGSTTLELIAEAERGTSDRRLTGAVRFGRVVGASPEMRRLYPLFQRLASADVPLIIEGETGTGKEVLAESLHEAGPRADKPFVVFDCTAVPDNLIESALFGHERGSFTGAVATRAGVFEQADGGTLFIDEIGDLDMGLQSKLLRAIERSEVQRVGGTSWIKVKVRLITATRRDLDRSITEGRFRDDLFYRLAVARVELPPLRRRTGDVPVLIEYFWRELGGRPDPVPSDIATKTSGYDWPGNVRELRNVVVRRLALGASESDSAFAPPRSQRAPIESASPSTDTLEEIVRAGLTFPVARERVLAEFQRRFLEWTLKQYGGNVSKAAAACGIGRRYFYVLRSKSGDVDEP